MSEIGWPGSQRSHIAATAFASALPFSLRRYFRVKRASPALQFSKRLENLFLERADCRLHLVLAIDRRLLEQATALGGDSRALRRVHIDLDVARAGDGVRLHAAIDCTAIERVGKPGCLRQIFGTAFGVSADGGKSLSQYSAAKTARIERGPLRASYERFDRRVDI